MGKRKILKKYPRVYAFIDSQNLNLGVQSLGWKLDFKKFRIYLKDKFRVQKAFLFIGYIAENKNLYRKLKDFGYLLIFKPTLKSSKNSIKGGESSLLRRFRNYKLYVEEMRAKVERE